MVKKSREELLNATVLENETHEVDIKAKKFILKALKIRKKTFDTKSSELAVDLNTLSLIYQDL